jgi:hypothetical protein
MSQSVEPLTVNGNQLNLSDQASVLAHWVADTLDTGASGTIDPPRAGPLATRDSPPSTVVRRHGQGWESDPRGYLS